MKDKNDKCLKIMLSDPDLHSYIPGSGLRIRYGMIDLEPLSKFQIYVSKFEPGKLYKKIFF